MKSSGSMIKSSIAALVMASLMLTLAAAQTPSPPNGFYGTLTVDGSPAPAGTGIKGMVGAEDKTFNGPYETTIPGEYGSGLR